MLALSILGCRAPEQGVDPFRPEAVDAVAAEAEAAERASPAWGPSKQQALLARLDEVLEARPECHAALVWRARLLFVWGRTREAERAMAQVEKLFGPDPDLAEYRARIAHERSDGASAAAAASTALQRDSGNRTALLTAGKLLFEAADPAAAQFFERAAAGGGGKDEAAAYAWLAQAIDGAATAKTPLALDGSPDRRFHKTLGISCAKRGALREAGVLLLDVLRRNDRDVDALRWLAATLTRRRKYEQAEPLLRRAAALAPLDGRVWYELGVLLFGRASEPKQFDLAGVCFDRARRRMPEDPASLIAAGRAYANAGNAARAENRLHTAITQYPAAQGAWLAYVNFLRGVGDHEHALAICALGLKSVPDAEPLLLIRLKLWFELGQTAHATDGITQLQARAGLSAAARKTLQRLAQLMKEDG